MADSDLVHVVDDDVDVRKSLGFLLATADFAVRLHESATAFLSTAKGNLEGCIVTDVRMPGIDGIEFLRQLRAGGHTIPVIVMTGHADVALAVQAMKEGAADFIEKPEKYLPEAATEFAVKATTEGFVTNIATRDIGLAVVGLGGGRTRPDDKIDPAVGITRLLPIGAEVKAGDALALIHARSPSDAEAAAAAVLSAYAIGASKPSADKSVIRRILPRG
ncbi:response regulator [Mesorhizobium sp. M8A.F.Ca.ET.059.01.1.1]|nr:response regulator [Mesorhizobium sp. M8A.F.Ca.ET.059.01.1.1]